MNLTDFLAPIDTHVIASRGTVYVTTLAEECQRTDLETIQGRIVMLGGRPFHVRGVESRCVNTQHKGWLIGLLGEYLEAKTIDRALALSEDERGYTRDELLKWLRDDSDPCWNDE